jgi:hypothetical protein
MMPRSMVRRSPLVACALALALSAPANAARVRLAPGCYQSGERGALSGAGFSPNAAWTAKLGRTQRLGSGRTDARGAIHARFTAPAYHGTAGTRQLTLTIGDGTHRARTILRMTPLAASFSPQTGDPATMRVRWRVLGLAPRHGVYVHYVAPDGKVRRTLRIGTAEGECGILKTGPIALFPFRYTYGRWTLQVDASPAYSAATVPRVLIGFAIRRPPAR